MTFFAVFLAGCFFGERFSNPVLEIYGQKASAKSTCFKRIQDLIDPLTVNPLFPISGKENEVALCLTVKGILGDQNPLTYPSPVRMVDFYEMAVKAGRQLGYSEEKIL